MADCGGGPGGIGFDGLGFDFCGRHNTHFLFNLQLIFGGTMYTIFLVLL